MTHSKLINLGVLKKEILNQKYGHSYLIGIHSIPQAVYSHSHWKKYWLTTRIENILLASYEF